MKVPSVHSSAKAAGRPKATTGRIPVGIRSVVVKYTSSARGTGTSKPARSGFVAIKPFEVTRLRSLLKRRDYTSMMRKITPAFFRRGLRDVTARKSLLQLENALLREAQRLLNTGEYSQATKLLNKIVRLGGPLSSRAQSLKKAKTKAAVARRVFTKTRGSVKASGSAKVSARKARTKKAFKKNGGATRSPEPAPTKVAAPTGGVKRAAGRSGKRTAKSPKRAEGTSSAGPRLGPQAGPSAGPPPGPAPGSQSGRLPGSRRLSLAEDSAEMEYPAGLGAPDIRKIKGAEAPLGAPYIRNIEYEEAPETADVADDGGEAESAASEGDGSVGGERRSGEEKEQTEVLQRTPHMDLSTGESPLAPAAEFDVYVSVDSREARPGEETQELELEGPASQEEFPVEVTLVVSGHFEPVADGIRTMTVLRSGETAPVVFKVQCAKQFPAEKDAALSALFRYQGHAGGRVTRRFKVENGKLVLATPAAAEAAAAPAPIASKAKLAAVSGLEQYDLTINVIDTGENDSKHFRLIADSPPTGKHVDVLWTLGDKSDQIVRNYMVKFVAQGLKPTARLAEMKGAGAQLFEATPKEFRQMFWELIDSGKAPKTIMVISDEPYLPWELMVPRRMAGGKLESRSPLGVEFCVGRWIRPDNVSAPQQIHLDKTYVVAPKYVQANKNLKFAPQEAAFVCSSFHPSAQINPADIDPINNALRNQGATLLHFICHGSAGSGPDQTILLQDMVNNLSASTVDGLDGFLIGFPRDHTFVFLNACEVGRPAPALVGIGGLASTFLKLGASGVVAALWSVKDDLAHQVAQTFYERVLKEPDTPFAEILRDIRKQAYSGKAEDTYAAYCFYGSPLAKRKM